MVKAGTCFPIPPHHTVLLHPSFFTLSWEHVHVCSVPIDPAMSFSLSVPCTTGGVLSWNNGNFKHLYKDVGHNQGCQAPCFEEADCWGWQKSGQYCRIFGPDSKAGWTAGSSDPSNLMPDFSSTTIAAADVSTSWVNQGCNLMCGAGGRGVGLTAVCPCELHGVGSSILVPKRVL